nr:MAG TPA: hypothetical protein [Caudoviricetes sp.]
MRCLYYAVTIYSYSCLIILLFNNKYLHIYNCYIIY